MFAKWFTKKSSPTIGLSNLFGVKTSMTLLFKTTSCPNQYTSDLYEYIALYIDFKEFLAIQSSESTNQTYSPIEFFKPVFLAPLTPLFF